MGTFNAGSIEASLTLDRSNFVRELKAAREQARRFEAKGIDIDLKIKQGELTRLEQRLKSIKNNLGIDLNTKQAMINAQVLKDLLNSMTPHVIRVSVSSSAAKVSLTLLERRLKALDTTAHIKVDVDERGLSGSVGRISGRMQQWQAILLAIMAFLPILSGAMGIATAAIAGLTASLSAAGGGALLLGFGLAAVWKNAMKVKDATGAVKEFQDAVAGVKKAWADAVKAFQPVGLKVLTSALNIVKDLIPKLVPIFNAFGGEALKALDGLGKWFKSDDGEAMLSWFEKFGSQQFGTLLSILGNLGETILYLLESFSPFADIMMRGLEGVTKKWAEWAKNVANSDGFNQFIQYAIDNGPKLLDMLGSLIDAFINIGIAVAPLAGPMMTLVTNILDFIAGLDPAILGLILTGITAIWLAFQGVSVVMAGVAAVMAGGWIIVIVAAVMAVAAVVMYLWHTSETFRNKAMEIFGAVAAFIGSAMASIKAWFDSVWPDLQQIIEKVWPAIRTVIEVNLQAVWAAVKIVFAGVVAIIKIAAAIIGTVIHVLAALLRGDIPGALKAMKNGAVSVLSALWGFIKSVFGAIGGFIKGAVNAVKSNVGGAFTGMKNLAVSAVGSLKSGVIGHFSAILGRVRGLSSSIKGVFSGAGGWLRSAGVRIIQGLINGIRSMIGAVQSQLSRLTNMIPDWKGPKERDKKLLRPSGRWIMESLIGGVDDLMPKVEKKFKSVTDMIAGVGGASATVDVSGTVAPAGGRGDVIFNVFNPVAEKSSVTAAREMSGLTAMGVLG